MIIAVTGRMSAGETAFCKIVEKKGLKRLSLSDILREKLREQGKPVVRENLIELGDSLRKEMGEAAMAKLAWEKIGGGGDWVLDSIYAVKEAEFLRDKGAYLVGITAPAGLRFKRSLARGEKFPSLEEFIKFDDYDQRWGIDKMVGDADFVVSNDGTLEDLEKHAESILKTISSYPVRT
jgi:dephospho-CoA kinase